MVLICNKKYENAEYSSHFEKYPYELSDFQKYAIEAILKGHHVLVTAHTGSGKTLPAEFAIEHFVGQGKKVIYTSPIKALSNQKYYEFSMKYPHISFGLFTGDIKTNPEADVLIMTTEILMNALFRDYNAVNSTTNNNVLANTNFQIDLQKELAAVVFDEVHYINDADRGQTWEKTLVLLPSHVQKIMLSATIDSPDRFANWVESIESEPNETKKPEKTETKKVYLCSTHHRVVPLTHYIYLTVSESTLKSIKDKGEQQEMRRLTGDLICIQNDKGIFQENGYKQAKKINEFIEKNAFLKRKFVLNQLAQYLKNREMLPAIAFVFSRKNVEICAEEITVPLLEDDSKVPYIVRRECEQILRKLPNYEEYLHLPEYQTLVSLLEKGIGIHHSGMIPILREIVELLISKKYIKLLFATESFAIGLDCPIKTAIFTGLKKFDGSDHRYVYSHEYTQMAGRAGRRGIDTIGNVIHCNNLFGLPSQTEYKDILCGNPQNLVSKFRISYNWILNLLQHISAEEDPNAVMSILLELSRKSMIYEELQSTIVQQRNHLDTLEKETQQKYKFLECLRTPREICQQYNQCTDNLLKSVNKKKKELQRQIEEYNVQYRDIIPDSKMNREYDDFVAKIERKEKPHLVYLESYMTTQIENVLCVLRKNKFIYSLEELKSPLEELKSSLEELKYPLEELQTKSTWITYPLGNVACKLAEVHPLIWSNCICNKWAYMSEFTVKQIIGLFSCITDIKVAEEYKLSVVKTTDSFLKFRVDELLKEYETYSDLEIEMGMRTGIVYDSALNFDLLDESMEWCDCNSEEECKWFIQTRLFEKEISVGDFAKAMMKIATMAKEMASIVEFPVDLQHKLSQIDGFVLKYIATAQSLYV